MEFLNEHDYTHFVEMKKIEEMEESLSEATLKEVPNDLVKFFAGEGIQPNKPVEPDEIVIEPFDEDDDVQADIVISPDTGDVEVSTEIKPPVAEKIKIIGNMGKVAAGKQARRILNRQKRQFGRVRMNMQRKFDRMVDGQIKQALPEPIANAMSTGNRRRARGQAGKRRARARRARRRNQAVGDEE